MNAVSRILFANQNILALKKNLFLEMRWRIAVFPLECSGKILIVPKSAGVRNLLDRKSPLCQKRQCLAHAKLDQILLWGHSEMLVECPLQAGGAHEADAADLLHVHINVKGVLLQIPHAIEKCSV